MKIETQNIYNSKKPANYAQIQIERSMSKIFSVKPESFYAPVVAELNSWANLWAQDREKLSMICMGTRNNAERDIFGYLTGIKAVFSLDIADNAIHELRSDLVLERAYQGFLQNEPDPNSVLSREEFAKLFLSFYTPDFVMDFTSLPENWTDKWDFLYSNSLDHSYDPTATFREWVRAVKTGGFLALGFSLEEEASTTDPSAFKKQDILKFLSAEVNVRCLSTVQEGGFENFIIKKIGM